MLNELDIVRDVSQRLDRAGIAYMLTGSMAMNYYAQPRMTRDIDLVVALAPEDSNRIVALFRPDYYVSEEAVRDSIATKSIFNLIHEESVIKVDCVVRKDTPYRRAEFQRRQRIEIDDFSTWIATKEDLIISKLDRAKDSFRTPGARRAKPARHRIRPGLHPAVDKGARLVQPLGAGATMNDTSPEIADEVRRRLMSLPNATRFIMGAAMFDAARAMVIASLPKDTSDRELRRRLFECIYGEARSSPGD